VSVLGRGTVHGQANNEHDDAANEEQGPPSTVGVRGRGQVGIAALTTGGQGDLILDGTAALEDVGVVGAGVAFADDIGAAKLELLGQLGGAAPLDVLVTVRGALVGAAHNIEAGLGEAAQRRMRYALELRDGGHAAMLRLSAVASERQGLDLREEDGIARLATVAVAAPAKGGEALGWEEGCGEEQHEAGLGRRQLHGADDEMVVFLLELRG
jgi:hypothetical protein